MNTDLHPSIIEQRKINESIDSKKDFLRKLKADGYIKTKNYNEVPVNSTISYCMTSNYVCLGGKVVRVFDNAFKIRVDVDFSFLVRFDKISFVLYKPAENIFSDLYNTDDEEVIQKIDVKKNKKNKKKKYNSDSD